MLTASKGAGRSTPSTDDVGAENAHQLKRAGLSLKLAVVGSNSMSAAAGMLSMLNDCRALVGQAQILVKAQQHVGRLAPVSDEYKSVLRSLLGGRYVLIELTAGE